MTAQMPNRSDQDRGRDRHCAEAFAAAQGRACRRRRHRRPARGGVPPLREAGLPHRRVEEWKYTDLRALMRDAKPLARRAGRRRARRRRRAPVGARRHRGAAPRVRRRRVRAGAVRPRRLWSRASRSTRSPRRWRAMSRQSCVAPRRTRAGRRRPGLRAQHGVHGRRRRDRRRRRRADRAADPSGLRLRLGQAGGGRSPARWSSVGADAQRDADREPRGPRRQRLPGQRRARARGRRRRAGRARQDRRRGQQRRCIVATLVAALGQGRRTSAISPSRSAARSCATSCSCAATARTRTSRLRGASLLKGRQHADTTLVVDHAVGRCQSRELFKSVLDDESRACSRARSSCARTRRRPTPG